jgi:hypothetical protein
LPEAAEEKGDERRGRRFTHNLERGALVEKNLCDFLHS